MAHRIEKLDRQQGLKQAWHGLTEVVPVLTLDDNWLTTWDVERVPLYLNRGNIQRAELVETIYSHLACTDNGHRVGKPVGRSYQEVSNATFLNLVRESIGGAGHVVESVGSVRNRGRVFVSVRLTQDKPRTVAGRRFQDYINFGNSHDLSSCLFITNTNVCTVCDNTYSVNLAMVEQRVNDDTGELEDSAVDITVRHTKHALARLPEIAKLIDKAVGVRAEFYNALNALDKTKCNEIRATRIFAGFEASEGAAELSAITRNRVGELVQTFKRGMGNRGETLADVFQATTEYYTHRSVNGNERVLERQFYSSEFGTGANAKRSMMRVLSDGERLEKCERRGERLLAASASSVQQFE